MESARRVSRNGPTGITKSGFRSPGKSFSWNPGWDQSCPAALTSASYSRLIDSTRADPDLEDPFPVELVHEDREHARHRTRRKAPRFVVNRRDAVEGQSARHRISHGERMEKCARAEA